MSNARNLVRGAVSRQHGSDDVAARLDVVQVHTHCNSVLQLYIAYLDRLEQLCCHLCDLNLLLCTQKDPARYPMLSRMVCEGQKARSEVYKDQRLEIRLSQSVRRSVARLLNSAQCGNRAVDAIRKPPVWSPSGLLACQISAVGMQQLSAMAPAVLYAIVSVETMHAVCDDSSCWPKSGRCRQKMVKRRAYMAATLLAQAMHNRATLTTTVSERFEVTTSCQQYQIVVHKCA